MIKINFGSGHFPLKGWVNVDSDPSCNPDVVADLGKPLPFDNGCASHLHSEDFFDQLPLDLAYAFLRDCHRLLAPGGVMRLLTPDLAKLAGMYVNRDPRLLQLWRDNVPIPLKTGSHCEVLNLGMRLGGHTFLYDAPTLKHVLSECGFDGREVSFNQSAEPELRGIDLRSPDNAISMYFDCYRV